MKNRILIPTDYSKNAYNAIRYAFDLFKNEECTFHILHSYFLAGYSTENLLIPEPDDASYQRVRDISEKNLENLKTQLGALSQNTKHTMHFTSEFGPLFDVLKKKVEKENIGLIVMGTRGETDDKSVAYGRNSVSVMEKVRTCPVLAVPANIVFTELKEIVFPTSFKSQYEQDQLKTVITVAQTANASISLLHIGKEKDLTEKQQKNKGMLENNLGELDYSFKWLEKIKVQDGIFKFVGEHNSGMIVFVNKKHWFFGSVFSNPLVKKLGIHSNVPLLALHDSRK